MNQITDGASPSVADTQPRPLGVHGRSALAETITFYEMVVLDYERIVRSRINEIDTERQRSQRYLDWLGEILKLIGGKNDDEYVVQAVARFAARANAELLESAQRTVDCRTAFTELCKAHNITEPCGHFTGTVVPLGIGAPAFANCDTCGHPAIVHLPPTATTEAAS